MIDGKEVNKVKVTRIILSDETEVDITDTTTTYKVCTSNFSATVADANGAVNVFADKTPLLSEADAPIDNETIIELLRNEKEANDGLIDVDTELRGDKLNLW